MAESLFKIIRKGLLKEVRGPSYGKQHQGVAPGGAMDLFSFRLANLLLKKEQDELAQEIVIPPELEFEQDCFFTFTGAKFDRVTLSSGNGETENHLLHSTVYQGKKGDILRFGNKIKGFRTYLAIKPYNSLEKSLLGRNRSGFERLFNWADPQGFIRLLEGPEFDYLNDKAAFTDTYWKITNDFSDMGFRLETHDKLPEVTLKNMVSEAVADGTIQLAPKGPIVLLKHRQTVGGYPRIYNVISADVDLLAQYAPNQIIRFKKITIDAAHAIARQKDKALKQL